MLQIYMVLNQIWYNASMYLHIHMPCARPPAEQRASPDVTRGLHHYVMLL